MHVVNSKFQIHFFVAVMNIFQFSRFVWRRHAGTHLDGLQHGGQKPTETSVTEFCYKSVNLSLEELKNIKIILFSVQIAKFPEISHFFDQHDSCLGRHVNAASRKRLEIQA